MKRVVCMLLAVLIFALVLTACQSGKTPEIVETTPVIQGVVTRRPATETDAESGDFSPTDAENFLFAAYGNGYSVSRNPEMESYPSCLTIPAEYKGKSVVKIEDMGFTDCGNVTEMVLPASVTEIGLFGLPMGIRKLTCSANIQFRDYREYNIEELFLTAGASSMTGTWKEMGNLMRLTIGSGIKCIEPEAFACCWKLSEVILPSGLEEIRENAFSECGTLSQINFPEGLKSIGEGAFAICVALQHARFPESLLTIGDYAFAQCMTLCNVWIGKNLSRIGQGAFCECSSLYGNFSVHSGNSFFSEQNGMLFDASGNNLYEYLFF